MTRREMLLLISLNLGLFIFLYAVFDARGAPETPPPDTPPASALDGGEDAEDEGPPPPVVDREALRARLEQELLAPLMKLREDYQRYELVSRARLEWWGAWECHFDLVVHPDSAASVATLRVFAEREPGRPVRSFNLALDGEALRIAGPDGSAHPLASWLQEIERQPWKLGTGVSEEQWMRENKVR